MTHEVCREHRGLLRFLADDIRECLVEVGEAHMHEERARAQFMEARKRLEEARQCARASMNRRAMVLKRAIESLGLGDGAWRYDPESGALIEEGSDER